MNALARETLFARDSQTLTPLARQLQQHGWHLVLQSVTRLQPDQWPPVGLVEIRTHEQRKKLEPLLPVLRQGHYLAVTDTDSMRCRQMQQLVASGFHDYFTWPCDPARLTTALGHALGMSALRSDRPTREQPMLLGDAYPMVQARHRIHRFAQSDLPVLLQGESGTGKECAARMIHQSSPRHDAPFVAVNCAAIPDTLFAAELFGHEKGAFTGASQARRGRIHDAGHGSLFLDEIGDMDAASQATLLRFLESGSYTPLGGSRECHSRARIICASNRPLARDVEEGRFRLDLFHRINVLSLSLPPLRDHPDDVLTLSESFLSQLPGPLRLSNDARAALQHHPFPGNVRELRNCLWRAAALSDDGLLTAAHLGLTAPPTSPHLCSTLREFREQQEKQHLRHCLHHCQGDVQTAARLLGISRSSLYRMLDKYQLPTHD
ncbi:MAG: sigma-54 dependent transcriptional regulator [Pseudomonadota bacterium]|nr:sigma-54 dependent transcriptional regulator [Pseudomonadota bacterium]